MHLMGFVLIAARRTGARAGRAAFMLGTVLCLSCSNQREAAPTRGRITFNGEPLRSGSVLFVPTEPGPTAQANLLSSGEYVLSTYEEGDGAVIGRHQIMVIALAEDGKNAVADASTRMLTNSAGDPLPLISVIPEQYGDYKKSGLTASVAAGENRIDFALTSEPTVTESAAAVP